MSCFPTSPMAGASVPGCSTDCAAAPAGHTSPARLWDRPPRRRGRLATRRHSAGERPDARHRRSTGIQARAREPAAAQDRCVPRPLSGYPLSLNGSRFSASMGANLCLIVLGRSSALAAVGAGDGPGHRLSGREGGPKEREQTGRPGSPFHVFPPRPRPCQCGGQCQHGAAKSRLRTGRESWTVGGQRISEQWPRKSGVFAAAT